MNNIDNLIENLNKEQKEAVLSTEGAKFNCCGCWLWKDKSFNYKLIHIINQKKHGQIKFCA